VEIMAQIIKQVSEKLANLIQNLRKSNAEVENSADLPSQKNQRYFT
jgi:hypothetical protein